MSSRDTKTDKFFENTTYKQDFISYKIHLKNYSIEARRKYIKLIFRKTTRYITCPSITINHMSHIIFCGINAV